MHPTAFIVYDITKRETFEHLADWMHELETYTNVEDSVKMIVGNKIDKVRRAPHRAPSDGGE